MGLLSRWYSRRIVNVNVNIVLAGLIALGPAAGVAHLTTYLDIHHAAAITAITLAADGIFDVITYYVLHWYANHRSGKKGQIGIINLDFIRDASLVQFERALLLPLFYGVTAGISWWLIGHKIVGRELGTVIALLTGILVTRLVHTIWMLNQERRAARAAAAVKASDQTISRTGSVVAPGPPPMNPRTPESAAGLRTPERELVR